MADVKLIHGDCLEIMPTLDANSIDSIVCDPPYGLSFMGKHWDHGVPGVAFWEAALRVAKPGAHLLAFGGTRTFHRLTVAIEDAGWEIRDCLMWLYGSGFPKSHDIGKAIDKAAGIDGEWVEHPQYANRNGNGADSIYGQTSEMKGKRHLYKSTSEAAQQFNGWGTALKPAWEPVIMARKPLEGTVAANVLQWGVGGLNIDASRIGTQPGDELTPRNNKVGQNGWKNSSGGYIEPSPLGRWPANLLLDEEAARVLDEQSGISGGGNIQRQIRKRKGFMLSGSENNLQAANAPDNYGDTGGASHFFYVAKASKRDRDEGLEGMEERPTKSTGWSGESMPTRNDTRLGRTVQERPEPTGRNHHPTVKPTQLMRYLCRLVTPAGGVVLDPFAGSGSTLKAAILEGFNCIGIELDAEYIEIARRRIEHAQQAQMPLLVDIEH